jgi:hypothetical protein
MADMLSALMIVQYVTMQKPIAWQYGRRNGQTAERKEAFLSVVLPVE